MQTFEDLSAVFKANLAAKSLHHAWVIEGAALEQSQRWVEEILPILLGKPLGDGHFHPNVRWLDAVETHAIDSVRELISFLERTSWDGGWKVGVIMAANHMNIQAQNALLKMMEEPPANTLLLLISESSGALLETIYSRGFYVVLQQESKQTETFQQFQQLWVNAVFTYLNQGSFDGVFEVQSYLSDEEIDAETQGKWVMLAFKQLLDSAYAHLQSKNEGLQTLSKYTHKDWLQQWSEAGQYLHDALFLKVDLKQFCVKLTTKLLV